MTTQTVTGANGANGTSADGVPGGNGGPGQSENVSLTAPDTAGNSLTVTGGSGGAGGQGGYLYKDNNPLEPVIGQRAGGAGPPVPPAGRRR